MHARATLAFVAIAALSGCSDRGGQPNARGGGPGVIRNGLSDSEVAEALATIQSSQIEQAQVAHYRSSDPSIQTFADQLAKQATHAGHEENETLVRLRIAPRDSALSRQLQGESIDRLRGLYLHAGPGFDREFLLSQVQATERSLSVVDGLLIPNAHQPELRNRLEQTRGALLRQLDATHGLLATMPASERPEPSASQRRSR